MKREWIPERRCIINTPKERKSVEKLQKKYPFVERQIAVLLECLQRSGLQDHPEDYSDLLFYYDGVMNAWFVKPVDGSELVK